MPTNFLALFQLPVAAAAAQNTVDPAGGLKAQVVSMGSARDALSVKDVPLSVLVCNAQRRGARRNPCASIRPSLVLTLAIDAGTATFWDPRSPVRIAEELAEFLQREKIGNVRELVGTLKLA